jgi:hypothetical protein
MAAGWAGAGLWMSDGFDETPERVMPAFKGTESGQ